MVKDRISATVDEKTVKMIERILSRGKFRNKSHVIEEAISMIDEYLKHEHEREAKHE